MSKQIDERVVSMQFDNQRFEKNVQTSMNTLDKLKQKLNLTGASKGLENVQTAANKVNMSGLSNSVETVRTKFSALEVMGVTALANLTNSAVNAGKRMIHALTIAPVSDGFNEYEMTLNAIQTTMAATGKTSKEVQEELKKLDEYADKTVYSTADMLNNLPKFTNAGVKLESATKAMIGIANATALAGGDAGKASIAFYNLGQAIGTGYLTRMDYNSINNAGIATMEWKNQMVEAAIAQGTLTKVGEDQYKAGNKTLTLQQLFIDGLQEQWATTDVMMKVFSDYGDETTEIGKKSYSAAQDIKTFSMMMDSLKATAGTGWKDTWQLIFGDLEAAKKLWTGVTNAISAVITKMADIRNGILESAFGKSFSKLGKEVKKSLEPIQKTAKAVKTVTDTVKDYGKVVDQIIGGEWGTGQARWDKLTKAGYDWAHAQNLVNEKLGDSTRHATKYKEAQDAANKSKKEGVDASNKLSKADAKTLENLLGLSDAQLKSKGYTEEQIKAFRELEETAKKLGLPISEFIEKIDEIDGRWLVMEGFANIWRSVAGVFKAMKTAWQEIFNPKEESMVAKIANGLFNLIAAFHKFTRSLLLTDESGKKLNKNGEKLMRTFKGIFAIFDIILTVVGGPLKIAFKILTQILGAFDMNILDLTAIIGDIIVKFRNWLKSTLDFTKVFKAISPYIKKAVSAIKDWVEETKPLEKVAGFIKKVAVAVKDLAVAFKNSQFFETGVNIVKGLINGIKNGISGLWNIITSIAKGLIDKVKNILGIHSPSLVFMAIGGFIVSGLLLGIKNGAPQVWETIKGLGSKCVEVLKNIDFGALIAGAVGIGLLVGVGKIINILDKFASPFEGLGNLLSGIGDGIEANLKAKALEHKSEALLNLAKAIALLVGSVFVLTKIDTGKLWSSIGALAALAAIVVVLAFVSSKMANIEKFKFPSGTILGVAIALLAMSIVLKKLASIDSKDGWRAMAMLAVLLTGLIGIMVAVGKFIKGKTAANVDKVGKLLSKLAIALLLMIIAVKLCAKLSVDDVIKGSLAIAAFAGIIVGLTAASKLAGKRLDAVGNMILKTSAAILLMAITVKLMADMRVSDIVKGTLCVLAFAGIIVGLMAATKLIGPNVNKIGSSIMGIAAAMLIMSLTVAIISRLSPGDLAKGIITIALFGGIIAGLMYITHFAGENAVKAGLSLVLISACIAVLTAVVVALSTISLGGLIKGITVTALLGALMVGLIYATKDAEACKGNIITMSVAIAVLALSVALLSRIDGSKLAGATLAMTILVGMFAILIKSANNINSSIGPLIVMTVAIALLAGMVALLAKMDVVSVLGSALALSTVILAMSVSLVVLSGIGKIAKDALVGVLILTSMTLPLLAFVGVLALMQNIQNAISNVYALTILATAMTLLLIPLSFVGAMGMAGLPFIGVAALLSMAVPLLAFVGILALMQNIQNATENANLLITMATAMTALLVVLAVIGPMALVGVTALTAMSGLMLALGVLVVSIGALMEKFPMLQQFLNTGLSVLIQIAGGIGQMIGAFVGGVMTQLSAGLPTIGANLSLFMTNATPFIIGAKMVDASVLKGVGILAGAVIALTAADLINGVLSFLSGGSSFADLGTQLSLFMMNAMPFIMGASMLTPEMTTGVKNLAETILILTGAGVLDGLTSWFTGGVSLADYGKELAAFGPGLKSFADSVAGIDGESIKIASSAAKTLAEMTATIPNEGGVVGWFAGENSIAKFASQLPALGTGLKGFSDSTKGINGEGVKAAAEAAKSLTEMTSTIPNEGGVVGWFAGENSIAKFASGLSELGKGLKGFSDNTKGINPENVTAAANAAKSLAKMSDTIPNEGGVVAWFTGNNSMAKFASNLPKLGTGIKGFSDKVKGIDAGNVTAAAKAVEEMTKTIDKISKVKASAADGFNKAIKKLGETNVDSLVKAFTNAENKMKSAGQKLITNFVEGINNYKSKVDKVAKETADKVIDGIEDKEKSAKTAGSDLAKKAADGVSDKKRSFKSAGKDLGNGLIEGINAKKTEVYNAAYALGQEAVRGEHDGQESASPSKATIRSGKWLGEGLVIGVERMTRAVYKSAHGLGETATGSISNAVSRISDMVNSDMDAQPTIRPVLDLSNVRAGAGSINSLFSGRTLAVDLAGVGALSASMSGIQNGNNSREIVSSIKALRKDIANMPRNTTTINGITYDDGSNINTAVETLVRAAKIERRV